MEINEQKKRAYRLFTKAAETMIANDADYGAVADALMMVSVDIALDNHGTKSTSDWLHTLASEITRQAEESDSHVH